LIQRNIFRVFVVLEPRSGHETCVVIGIKETFVGQLCGSSANEGIDETSRQSYWIVVLVLTLESVRLTLSRIQRSHKPFERFGFILYIT
jgi:hypothetical protein